MAQISCCVLYWRLSSPMHSGRGRFGAMVEIDVGWTALAVLIGFPAGAMIGACAYYWRKARRRLTDRQGGSWWWRHIEWRS